MNNPAKIGNGRYYQGVYQPANKKKILGDSGKLIYRSSWERKVCHKLDFSDEVIAWGMECFPIWYKSPKDGIPHRYFPDFVVVTLNKDTGKKEVTVIEVKPYKETLPPKKQGKKKSRYKYEVMTYAVNKAKWDAAEVFCKNKGWNFHKLTEKEILKNGNAKPTISRKS